jgi:hypothetical protein
MPHLKNNVDASSEKTMGMPHLKKQWACLIWKNNGHASSEKTLGMPHLKKQWGCLIWKIIALQYLSIFTRIVLLYYSRKTHFNEMVSEANQTVPTRSQTQRPQTQKIVTYSCSNCFSKIRLQLTWAR